MHSIKVKFVLVLSLLITPTLYTEEGDIENGKIYDNCMVWEKVDSFTDERTVRLSCSYDDPDDWLQSEAIVYVVYPLTRTAESVMTLGFKTIESIFHVEDKIKVRYRFDKNELQEEQFLFDIEKSVAYKRLSGFGGWEGMQDDADNLKTILEWLLESDKVVFDLGGASSETIELTGSRDAVKDFAERMAKHSDTLSKVPWFRRTFLLDENDNDKDLAEDAQDDYEKIYDHCRVFEKHTETEIYEGMEKKVIYNLVCQSEDKKNLMSVWVHDSQPLDIYFGLTIEGFKHDNHPSKSLIRVRAKSDKSHLYEQTFHHDSGTAFWKQSRKSFQDLWNRLEKGEELKFAFEQKTGKIFKKIPLKGIDKAVKDFKERLAKHLPVDEDG